MDETTRKKLTDMNEEAIGAMEVYISQMRWQLSNPSGFHTEAALNRQIRWAEKKIEQHRNILTKLQAHPQA